MLQTIFEDKRKSNESKDITGFDTNLVFSIMLSKKNGIKMPFLTQESRIYRIPEWRSNASIRGSLPLNALNNVIGSSEPPFSRI